jgi:hypothetical protein
MIDLNARFWKAICLYHSGDTAYGDTAYGDTAYAIYGVKRSRL